MPKSSVSANGAVFAPAWGNSPGIMVKKITSAESAIQVRAFQLQDVYYDATRRWTYYEIRRKAPPPTRGRSPLSGNPQEQTRRKTIQRVVGRLQTRGKTVGRSEIPALAKQKDACLLTGDRKFKSLEKEIKITWLRPR